VTAPASTLNAPGLACVDLTRLIAASIRGLRPGDVLEVRTDDPAARLDIPAWCRLTGNPLLGAAHYGPAPSNPSGRHRTRFRIAKRERERIMSTDHPTTTPEILIQGAHGADDPSGSPARMV
jgi:tRNA 2-thiouridine synthesizing protein A